MHYLRDGLGMPRLGWLYALVAGVAALTTTPFTQPNSIAVVLQSELGVPTWVVGRRGRGADLAGDHRRHQVDRPRRREAGARSRWSCTWRAGLLVIVAHAGRSCRRCWRWSCARRSRSRAAAGSAAGLGIMVAMRYGLARGIYANEAGYGTAAVAYGTARSERPVQQGLNAVMEVFIISFVTSTISALTILVTGVWRSGPHEHRRGGARPSTRRCRWWAAGWWPSARSCSATRRSSAGRTTASSSSSTSSARGS